MSQDSFFLHGEGDSWYTRNQLALTPEFGMDGPLHIIQQYNVRPESVVEVGCSNGWRLGALAKMVEPKRIVGVEPSAAALAAGRASFPQIEFHQGTAATTILKEKFDLVIVNFVLHWIDRETLFASLANIDALVKDGGYLIIGDFAPDAPVRTRYHHLPNERVYTFKCDYAGVFTASHLYTLVNLTTYHHSTRAFDPAVPGHNRASVALLRKAPEELYPEMVLPQK